MARPAMARPSEATAKPRPAKLAKAGTQQESVENALPNLDRIIHERMRLGIVSALSVNDSLTFNELKKLLQTTDGNLSVHARRLEEAHYVDCTKSFEGRMPKTEYRLTAAGRVTIARTSPADLAPDDHVLADAGVGLAVRGWLFAQDVRLRIDAPLVVRRPRLAVGALPGEDPNPFRLRLALSLADLW